MLVNSAMNLVKLIQESDPSSNIRIFENKLSKLSITICQSTPPLNTTIKIILKSTFMYFAFIYNYELKNSEKINVQVTESNINLSFYRSDSFANATQISNHHFHLVDIALQTTEDYQKFDRAIKMLILLQGSLDEYHSGLELIEEAQLAFL